MSGHWLEPRRIPVVGMRRLRAHQNAWPVTIRTRLSFMAAFPVLETINGSFSRDICSGSWGIRYLLSQSI
jgi:hypothetical protein